MEFGGILGCVLPTHLLSYPQGFHLERKRRFQEVQAAVQAAQSVGPFDSGGAIVLRETSACCTEPGAGPG